MDGSGYDKAEASPGFLFWRAFNDWSHSLRVELEKIGLTQAQYSILAAVSYLGSAAEVVSQQDVSNQLSMDKMMVSDVVKTLEKKGMLKRNPHPYDGRAVALQLTFEARRALKVAIPLVEAIDEGFFGKLGPDKLKVLKQLLVDLGAT